MQIILAQVDPLEHVLPHPIFGNHLTWFSNQSVMILVASLLLITIFPALFGKPDSGAPSGLKNMLETILQFMRDEVFRPVLKDHTDEFVPFLWTIFFFILFGNILGCLPLPEIIDVFTGGHLKHMGGAFTGSINTTATLAVIAFFYIHFHGIAVLYRSLVNGTYGHHHGPGPVDIHEPAGTQAPHPHLHKMSAGEAVVKVVPVYLWNFAPHVFKDKGPLFDVPMWFVLLIIELIGAVIKPFALCMRLFGNMVSGHMVLAVLIGLIIAAPSILGQVAVGVPIMALDLLIQLLEVLVAFLQAYIFAFLTALFIAGAVAPEH
jgi:F-type H+-transporting ATPase subunit a